MNRDNRHGFQDAWFSRLEPRVHDAWQQHCLRRVHAGAGQALEAILMSTLFGLEPTLGGSWLARVFAEIYR